MIEMREPTVILSLPWKLQICLNRRSPLTSRGRGGLTLRTTCERVSARTVTERARPQDGLAQKGCGNRGRRRILSALRGSVFKVTRDITEMLGGGWPGRAV